MKYKIRGYDKAYSDSLMDDKNFNIVARMMIPLEECERYCREEAHRGFKTKYWRSITIKIAKLPTTSSTGGLILALKRADCIHA